MQPLNQKDRRVCKALTFGIKYGMLDTNKKERM